MANLSRHPVLGRNQNLNDIVEDYFRKGYTYLELLEFLKVHYEKTSTLKRVAFVDHCWEEELTLMRSKKLYKRSYMEVDLI